MLREKIVFGPIFSRRLGSSLGINLLPENGKLCNFDCVYCECGWNRDGRADHRLPTPSELRNALNDKLSECRTLGIDIDSITFSGDGEPTLNPSFPEMVDIAIEMKDKYYPHTKITVLTNATMTGKEEIRSALMKVDNPVLKLDAPTDELARLINRPAGGYSVEEIVSNMKKFDGKFVLQTMFLRFPGFDSTAPDTLAAWLSIVKKLMPREIMVYTLAREAPMQGLEKMTEEEMRKAVAPLIEEGYNVQIRG